MRSCAFYLSVLLIFTSSWENILFFEGVGRISRLIGLLLAAVWMLTVLTTGEFRRLRPFHMAFALFVLWCISSIFWTIDMPSTYERIKTFVQLLILVIVLWDLYRTSADVELAMQAYVLGGFVSIGSVIINYCQSVTVMHQRFAATGFHPNDFGLIVALGLPMAWYLAVLSENRTRSRLLRLVNLLYLPAALSGIMLAASRGSLIAASPIGLLIAVSLGRLSFWTRAVGFATVVCALIAVPLVAPAESIERLLTINESIRSGDMNGRIAIWREGTEILSSHEYLGVGSGGFRTAASENRTVAHNVFMSVVVETGLVGLLLFVATLGLVLTDALRQPKWKTLLWLTVLLVWLLGALVHTWEQRKQTWIVFSFVTASAAAASQIRRSETGFNEHHVQLSH